MFLARILLLLCLLPLFAACSPGDVVPDADEDIARQVISDLLAHQDERVIAVLLPDVKESLRAQLPKIAALLPTSDVGEPELLEARHLVFNGTERTVSEIVYAVRGTDRAIWIRIGVLREPNLAGVGALYVGDLGAIEAANAFSFSGKPALNYIFLVLMAISFAVSLAAAIMAFRMPGLRRRWAWILGSLIGITRITLNWNTGQVMFEPLHIVLLGAGFSQSSLSPWFLSASVPVIAIAFLLLGDRLVRRA